MEEEKKLEKVEVEVQVEVEVEATSIVRLARRDVL